MLLRENIVLENVTFLYCKIYKKIEVHLNKMQKFQVKFDEKKLGTKVNY